MRRKKFFHKSFPNSDRQKNPAAVAPPNLVSPTESEDGERHDQQRQSSPAETSLHSASTAGRSPTNPAPKTGILRYHLNDDGGNQKNHVRTSSSSSTPKGIPKILLLIERGDWIRVEERAREHPHECSVWVSLVKKVLGSGSGGSICSSLDGEGRMVLGSATSGSSLASLETSTSSTTAMACNRTSQCKALHHACKKLRSVHARIQRLIQQHRSSEGEDIISGTLNKGLHGTASGDISWYEAWMDRNESDKDESYTDPWIEACKAILALIKAHPKAAGERESRHGCLPLHLAAFAMRRTKTSTFDTPCLSLTSTPTSGGSGDKSDILSSPPSPSHPVQHLVSPSSLVSPSIRSNSSSIDRYGFMDTCSSGSSCCFTAMLERDADDYQTKLSFRKSPLSKQQQQQQQQQQPQQQDQLMKSLRKSLSPDCHNLSDETKEISTGRALSTDRPPAISTRVASTGSSLSSASATFHHTNLNALSLSYQPRSVTPTEQFTSSTQHFNSGYPPTPNTEHSSNDPPFNLRRYLSNAPLRDRYSLLVIEALLSAYPPSPRVDSEGTRLPLHMALEGHATLPVLQALVDAYPPAARRRTGDGSLPLHLAAERGVGDVGVAGFLLGAYPDGGVARNRFDRTPFEEALLAAGENGRDFQTDFIRSVVGWGGERGAGGYGFLPEDGIEVVVNESDQGNEHAKSVTPNLQTVTNLVQSHSWDDLIFIVETHPSIARQKIHTTTRSGIPAQTTLLYLISEQNPTYDVIDVLVNTYSSAVLQRNHPGGKTPLHAACTWGASVEVVGYLLAATGVSSGGGGGARQRDVFGNLPLHAACYAGAKNEVISCLLCTLPKAVESRNAGGFLPADLVKRLWKGERGRVVRDMIEKTRLELEEERRRKESDDSERDQGEDRKLENRVNKFQREVKKSRTPDGKRTKGKPHLLRILKQGKTQELNKEKDGLLWV